MRILHVCDSFLPHMDGVIVSIIGSSNYQLQQGHDVFIFAPKYPKNPKLKNITIKRFFSLPAPSYEGYRIALPSLVKLSAYINKIRPDIIHLHGLPGILSLFSMSIAKKEKIKLVATYHTSFPDILVYLSPSKIFKIDKLVSKFKLMEKVAETYGGFAKSLIRYKPIKQIMKKNKDLSTKNVWILTKKLFDQPDLVIAPSRKIDTLLKKNNVGKKIEIISNGVDLKHFSQKRNYPLKNIKFLHVGRLGFEKKIEILLKAVSVAKKNHPNVSLSIVGDGPARDYLENIVSHLNIENNVKFLGFKDRKILPEIYKKFDVFLTASVMETQGIVLIEAMSCGLPVIGVNVLAIPDLVKNGYNGFLAKRDNVKEIAQYINYFIQNPQVISELGINARKTAMEHDFNVTNSKLLSAYNSLINSNNLVSNA